MRHVHIDLCSGTGALGLHLFGLKPLCTQHGNKQRYAHAVQRLTGWSRPDLLVMVDAGPWPVALAALNEPNKREAVLAKMRAYCGCPPMGIYSAIIEDEVPKDEVLFVARFLLLMRWSFRGIAVSDDGGQWKTNGIAKTSMFGVEPSRGQSSMKPQLPQMVKRIEAWPYLPLHCIRGDAQDATPDRLLASGVLRPDDRITFTFDPPYDGTRGYFAELSRAGVLGVARALASFGEGMVHEQEALPLAGWEAMPIGQWRKGRKSQMQTAEWVTCTPGLLRWMHETRAQLALGEAA